MIDVSGFGLTVALVASTTFPNTVTLSEFADDSDPFDAPDITVLDKATGLNGDLVTWSKSASLDVNIAVIAGGIDDLNLSTLLEANRVGLGKTSAQDVIDLTVIYPDGSMTTWNNGKILKGPPNSSVASAGRLKAKVYSFTFENKDDTEAGVA